MSLITRDELNNALARYFTDTSNENGRQCFNENKVVTYRLFNKNKIDAKVLEDKNREYQVSIAIGHVGTRLRIGGECTCPEKYNCLHVVATLYAVAHDAEMENVAVEYHDLVRWLQAISDPANSSRLPRHHIRYILNASNAGLYVVPQTVRQDQPGSYLDVQPIDIMAPFGTGRDKPFTDDDRLITWMLRNDWNNESRQAKLSKYNVLQFLINTKKLHWKSVDTEPIVLAETIHPKQEYTKSGAKSFALDKGVLHFELDADCYFNPMTNKIGLIHPEEDPSLEVAEVLISPDIYLHTEKISLSDEPMISERISDVQMKRLLKQFPSLSMHLLNGHFDYAGTKIPFGAPGDHIIAFHNSKWSRINRDLKLEKKIIEQIEGYGFIKATNKKNLPFYVSRDDYTNCYAWAGQSEQKLLEFNHSILPELEKQGWLIKRASNYDFHVIQNIDEWYADVQEATDNEWFSLELGIVVDGKKVNLLPVLLDLIQNESHLLDSAYLQELPDDHLIYGRTEDGKRVPLPVGRIRSIMATLSDLWNLNSLGDEKKMILNKLQAPALTELNAALKAVKLRWVDDSKIREFGEKLINFEGIPAIAPPTNLMTDLRPYQKEGLNWLHFLRDHGLGGILADDMGLGKTVQTLAHILIEKNSGRMQKPCLVVAPTSLLPNWRQETEKFAPELKVLTIHGPNRASKYKDLESYDLVVTTYPLLVRDRDVLIAQEFHIIILDEAHLIKNPSAKMTQVSLQLKGKQRICLTGTPLENHLGEMWSLFHFLMPGLLGSRRLFQSKYRAPIEKGEDLNRSKQLASRVRPFLMRRTKVQVVKELPPKVEIMQKVGLEDAQRDLYESVRLTMESKVREAIADKGFASSQILILDALLKLRQICCDPRLTKLPGAMNNVPSAKLNLLMELLPEMIEEGRRILLFSQFTSMLDLIKAELIKENISYCELTGQTKDRETPVKVFQEGKVPLMLISLKAGGTGLNLTRADTVIHYDPWWNPAVENQATDRAHRIGQDKSVFVYKLITEGTVEEKIIELQKRKSDLFMGVFDESGGSSPSFTQDDLKALFEPL